ncbi:hypothetical protein [Paenibacillus sedimenti]|uniref:Uncharacterized protein n=1 Tax=Paenibacillus sedimenti TaxID=2770274 RepID=A0A926KMX5_9BACL|nr:hypothetical protein [Paenibacillus sedimenti]MBD0380792.1 hypothetical protein [Paenibacillus sedimenti]
MQTASREKGIVETLKRIQKESSDLMKKIRKILFYIVAVYLIFFIGFHAKQQITAYKARFIAINLLDNIVKGHYDEAFKNVYYYDGPYDYDPTIEYDDAEHKWTDRVKEMKNKGIYLSSYSSLKTRFNDGWVYGSADLIINVHGEESKYHTLINYNIGEKGIKIATLQSFEADGSDDAIWEKNLSGYISKED